MSRMGWDRVEDQEVAREEDVGVRGRLILLRVFIVVIFGLLLYRIYWVQQTKGEELQTLAKDNQFAILRSDPPRGVVFDRNGNPLAINQPSFNVTITPAFLPDDDAERTAIFARLSFLTGVPITNTVQQEALIEAANPELVETYSRLARIYNAPIKETLDNAGVVPQLPDSIEGIVRENNFAQYIPAVITNSISITDAFTIEQESIFLPGVRVIPESLRYYPTGEYTASILGYMGPIPNEEWIEELGYQRDDRVGWSGLESSMELELAGQKGQRQIEQDWTGRELRQIGLAQEPVPGLNLNMTLDLDLQIYATEILQQAMAVREITPSKDDFTGQESFLEVKQGAVIVLNPQTGEILAMVSLPTFDNNRFQTEVPVDYYLGLARDEYAPLVNHTISSIYPPGSTFKLVPASGTMQEGLVSPSRRLDAPGEITIPNRFAPNDPGRAQTFVCWLTTGHGLVDMRQGIAQSCDVYFYKISGGFDQDGEFVEGLGVDRIARYAAQFGFGRVQGVELPLEAKGDLPPNRDWKAQVYGEPWSTGDDYNLGIGQGFMTSTPLQVAQMGAVIANGGFLYRPSVIHHMSDEEGNIVFVDDNNQILAKAWPDKDGNAVVVDVDGNLLENPPMRVEFDADGNYIYQPEVLEAVQVDTEYLEVVQEGMRLVNEYIDDDNFGTGATTVRWLDNFGIVTAGKTGTSEYCDNIAIEKGWCDFDDILLRKILPTHSWYVGYAPFDNPEIVVAAFLYNGGEGSKWAAPVACNVMAAYFGVGQYAPQAELAEGEEAPLVEQACPTANDLFTPDVTPQFVADLKASFYDDTP